MILKLLSPERIGVEGGTDVDNPADGSRAECLNGFGVGQVHTADAEQRVCLLNAVTKPGLVAQGQVGRVVI